MRTAAYYREKAARFRELAADADERTAADLIGLAVDYEAEAWALEPGPPITTFGWTAPLHGPRLLDDLELVRPQMQIGARKIPFLS